MEDTEEKEETQGNRVSFRKFKTSCWGKRLKVKSQPFLCQSLKGIQRSKLKFILYSTVGNLRGLRSASFLEGLLLMGCSLKASSMFAVLIIHYIVSYVLYYILFSLINI